MKLALPLLALLLLALLVPSRAGHGVNDAVHTSKDAHDAVLPRLGVPAPAPRPTPTAASRSRVARRVVTRHPGHTLNWRALAECESDGDPRAVSASGKYRGLYQFDLTTWRSVGGHGDPINASRSEQTYRARLLFADRGRSPWPVCGRRL